jgi:hypothetical protein
MFISGYNCLSCGLWVMSGSFHTCPNSPFDGRPYCHVAEAQHLLRGVLF